MLTLPTSPSTFFFSLLLPLYSTVISKHHFLSCSPLYSTDTPSHWHSVDTPTFHFFLSFTYPLGIFLPFYSFFFSLFLPLYSMGIISTPFLRHHFHSFSHSSYYFILQIPKSHFKTVFFWHSAGYSHSFSPTDFSANWILHMSSN